MVNTINPADAKPGEVYEGTVRGERRVLVRRDDDFELQWESLSEVHDHEDVSDLVRLVPARPVTRDDLPTVDEIHGPVLTSGAIESAAYCTVGVVLDAVVERLNANCGVPVSREDAALADRLERQAASIARLQGELETAERDRSRWRRAHGLVEQERITARAELAEAVARAEAAERELADLRGSLAGAEQERDQARDSLRSLRGAHSRLTRDYRHLSDRAEAAEARLEDPYSQSNQDAAAWKRIADHPALRMDILPEADHTYAGRVFERITWLAETAEAVTEMQPAPAVTREDVEECVYGSRRAGRECDSQGFVPVHIQEAVERLCDMFGVSTGQATDPVEQKARELFEVGYPYEAWEMTPERDSLRRIAAHVLGQEAGDA